MKNFACSHCGAVVFFENSRCLACGQELGYDPHGVRMLAFEQDDGGLTPCANRQTHGVCNWLCERGEGQQALCLSCRHTRVIPDLSKPGNLERWHELEEAKRRLFYSLLQWRLSLYTCEEDPVRGLAFDFKADGMGMPPVLTGHERGLVTINVVEADDAGREARRMALHEGYRTLLGHMRHEVGHYYWDRLIADAGPQQIAAFRAVFGDERQDYAQALKQHYDLGPQPDWDQHFVSAYASSHPWEDWAETWAHCLHALDALDTACHWGLQLVAPPEHIGVVDPIAEPQHDPEAFRQQLIRQWLPLSQGLNALSRSLGQGDLYPFALSPAVVDKLCFVHACLESALNDSP